MEKSQFRKQERARVLVDIEVANPIMVNSVAGLHTSKLVHLDV